MQGVYSKMLDVLFLVSKLETDNDKVSSDILNPTPVTTMHFSGPGWNQWWMVGWFSAKMENIHHLLSSPQKFFQTINIYYWKKDTDMIKNISWQKFILAKI